MSEESTEYNDGPPPDGALAPIISTIPSLNINQLIALYRAQRDELATERKAYKQREANVKDLLSRISMALRDIGDKLGVDSFSSPDGTAYRQVKTRYRVGNWDSVLEWVKATDNFQVLERRIGQVAMREIHNATSEIPPGVDYSAEVEFVVRKPSVGGR